jgi:hypothetical protein
MVIFETFLLPDFESYLNPKVNSPNFQIERVGRIANFKLYFLNDLLKTLTRSDRRVHLLLFCLRQINYKHS